MFKKSAHDDSAKLRQRLDQLLVLVAALWSYVVSVWIYQNYVAGDLQLYSDFWYVSVHTATVDLSDLQRRMLGAYEPVYWMTVRAASELFYRETFFTIVNVIIGAQLMVLLRRYDYPIILLPLIFTNFYLMVLYGPAERLKLSMLFLMMALLAQGRWRYFWLVITPFAHLQQLISVVLMIAKEYLETIRRLFEGRSSPVQLLIIGVFAILLVAVFVGNLSSGIDAKYDSYTEEPSGNPFLSLFLVVAATLSLRHRLLAAVVLLPLTMMAFLLGGARINMMTVIAVLLLFGYERRNLHILPVTLLLYFTYKATGFYSEVMRYGTNF